MTSRIACTATSRPVLTPGRAPTGIDEAAPARPGRALIRAKGEHCNPLLYLIFLFHRLKTPETAVKSLLSPAAAGGSADDATIPALRRWRGAGLSIFLSGIFTILVIAYAGAWVLAMIDARDIGSTHRHNIVDTMDFCRCDDTRSSRDRVSRSIWRGGRG